MLRHAYSKNFFPVDSGQPRLKDKGKTSCGREKFLTSKIKS